MRAAERVGAGVVDVADLGGGCGDILVGFRGVNYLIEIKDGEKPPSGRRLTEDESEFRLFWPGHTAVVKNEDELYAVLGIVGGLP